MSFWFKKKKNRKLCVWKFTEKDPERWETKLLMVSKPMVIQMEVDKGELKHFTLYILL